MPRKAGSRSRSKLNKRIGERVKTLRESQVMNQKTLASKAGISAPHLVLIESGQRGMTLGTVEKLAEGLEVSISELFSSETVQPAQSSHSKVLFRLIDKLRKEPEAKLLAIERLMKAFDAGIEAMTDED